jgi:catechol 2,3-dioxygenase-like lactoylglutathione lyase family enzyme
VGLFLDHVALATTNLEQSIAFYRSVMGFDFSSRRHLKDGREQAVFHIGEGVLILFFHADGRYVDKVRRPRSGVHHLAFGMDAAAFDGVIERCKDYHVEVLRKDINSGAKGEGYAAYFYDPDGNEIEIGRQRDRNQEIRGRSQLRKTFNPGTPRLIWDPRFRVKGRSHYFPLDG